VKEAFLMKRDQTAALNPLILQAAPVQYIHQEEIIHTCGPYIHAWGKRALISGGKRALEATGDNLPKTLDKSDIQHEVHQFIGECCDETISFIRQKAESFNADLVVGVGGGKALDAAKAASELCALPVVCVPTIAATCAATTALSVIYTNDGIFKRVFFLSRNPQLVLVDPAVIAQAPVDYLKAGILDSMAKWFEGRAVFRGIKNPDVYTSSALCLAELLYKQMRKKAVRAVELVKEQKIKDTLSHVIDMVIYLTGLIQSLGLTTLRGGVAHAINNGLTSFKGAHSLLHGIKVGYGIMIQLMLENVPEKEMKDIVSFFRQLGFAPSLKGLQLKPHHKDIEKIAKKAANDPYIGKMPFTVNTEMIAEAIEKFEESISKL
jgi:glycerol dehydrogenase